MFVFVFLHFHLWFFFFFFFFFLTFRWCCVPSTCGFSCVFALLCHELGFDILTMDEVSSVPSCSPTAADPGDWMGTTDLTALLDCSTVMTRTYVDNLERDNVFGPVCTDRCIDGF